MADSLGSITSWFQALQEGERDGVQPLWDRFAQRLIALARRKLGALPRRAADEEDVALSAFDSFCRGVEKGQFADVEDRGALWQLLMMITVRKAIDLRNHEQRQKRGGAEGQRPVNSGAADHAQLESLLSKEPPPELAVLLADECAYLMGLLTDEELRSIAVLKMEGCTDDEIASRLQCAAQDSAAAASAHPADLGARDSMKQGETGAAAVPLSLAMRVDQICREFEQAWRSGKAVSIEASLAKVPEHERDALRRELEPLAAELKQGGLTQPSDWPIVPGFRLLGELGRGGMGVVYRAEEIALGREVALKVLARPSASDRRHRQRFEREAKAAAGLHHTNIVPVFGFGEHQGLSYYAMQYIRGRSLSAFLDEMKSSLHMSAANDAQLDASKTTNIVSPKSALAAESATAIVRSAPREQLPAEKAPAYRRQVAQMGAQAASALEYAHRQGVVHRDIKPANLLLDPHGTVWIADFGLAKVLDDEELTQTGDLLGTLRYMPPEAFEAKAGAPGDIYSLGVTLYELLALRPAFAEADRTKLIKQKLTEEVKPLRRLDRAIPRDLATIVEKACEQEPARRYASAGELAADLQRFLDDEPIHARRHGLTEQLSRWVMKNRTIAALCAAVFVTLVAGTTFSIYFAVLAGWRADREESAATAAIQAKQHSDLQAAHLRFKEALRQAEAGAVDVGLFEMVEALRLAPRNDESAAFRRVVLMNLAAWEKQLAPLRYVIRLGGPISVTKTTVRPMGRDGASFAVLTQGQPVQFHATATGQLQREGWALPADESPLVVNGDATLLLNRVDTEEKCGLRLRRLDTGELVCRECPVPLLQPGPARPALFSSILSSRCVMSGAMNASPPDGLRRFWNLEQGSSYPLQLPCIPYTYFALIKDHKGKPVAVTVADPAEGGDSAQRLLEPFFAPVLKFWDVETGQLIPYPVHLPFGKEPRVGPGGRTFLSTHRDNLSDLGDGSVRWWDTSTGRLLDHWQARRQAYSTILMADGQVLAAHGEDRRVRIYDLDTGWQRGGDISVPGMLRIWDRNGGCYPQEPVLLTSFEDGLLRAWDLSRLARQNTVASNPRSRPSPSSQPPVAFHAATVAPSGNTVLLSDAANSDVVRHADTASGNLLGALLRQPHVTLVAFSPDERVVATAPSAYHDDTILPKLQVREARSGRLCFPPMIMSTFIHSLVFSPDGKTLAVGCLGATKLLNASTGEILHALSEKSCPAMLAFNADGTRLAIRYRPGWTGVGAGIRLWNTAEGQPLGEFQALSWDQPLSGMYFVENGEKLLALDIEGHRLVWLDGRTGQLCDAMPLTGDPCGLVVRPDEKRAAISYTGGLVQQWDIRAGHAVGAPMVMPAPVTAMEYSLDGRTLALVCKQKMAQIWDSATGLPLGPPLLQVGEVLAAHFTPDSREVVTASSASEVRRWPIAEPLPDDPDLLDLWLQALSGRQPTGGETALLDPDTWHDCCQRLQERAPSLAASLAWLRESPGPETRASWHDLRVREAEASGNTFAQRWHLDRLKRLRP